MSTSAPSESEAMRAACFALLDTAVDVCALSSLAVDASHDHSKADAMIPLLEVIRAKALTVRDGLDNACMLRAPSSGAAERARRETLTSALARSSRMSAGWWHEATACLSTRALEEMLRSLPPAGREGASGATSSPRSGDPPVAG